MEVALQLTDNASLRGMEGHDGKWYFSVYDFINFATGHEPGHDYAYQTFKRLVKPGSEHANEVLTNYQDFRFPGQGQKSTPCMTIRAACFEIESARQGTRQDTHACGRCPAVKQSQTCYKPRPAA